MLGKALLFNGELLPALEVADGVDDGPMVTCEIVVGRTNVGELLRAGAVVLRTSGVVLGTSGVEVPVAIVTDGRPLTVEHMESNAENKKGSIKRILMEGKVRTVDEALCRRNDADRRISRDGAIDAFL